MGIEYRENPEENQELVYCEQCDCMIESTDGEPACAICRPEYYDDHTKELNFSD